MKVIILEECVAEGNKTGLPAFYTKPDSTLIRCGKPMFVPGFTADCRVSIHLALRISRLGKSISQRFIHRYYDAATLCACFTAADVLDRLRGEQRSTDPATAFDGSLYAGEMVELSRLDFNSLTARISIGSDYNTDITHMPDIDTVNATLSALSHYFTLRQGDMVLLPALADSVRVVEDTHVSAWLGTADVVEFNVK